MTLGGQTYTQTTSGYFWDEDIRHKVVAQTTHKFMYREGTNGDWVTTAASNEVSYNNGDAHDVWNEYTGTTWKLTEGLDDTDFWIIFYIATPNLTDNTVYKIIGQNAYATKSEARLAIFSELNKLSTDGLPNPEFIFLYATIVKRNGQLQALDKGGALYLDLRTIRGGASGYSTSSSHADDILNDTTNFDNLLSSSDTSVQKALDTLDDGAVKKATSSTDNHIVTFDGTTGRAIQSTGVTVDDNNNLYGMSNVNYTGQGYSTLHTLTDASTVTINWNNGNVQSLTLGGDRTLANPTNTRSGATYILVLKQDATGSRNVTWGSNFKWSDGIAPILTTAANGVDVITFVCDGAYLYGIGSLNFK